VGGEDVAGTDVDGAEDAVGPPGGSCSEIA
jgi:hypothetical protein